jgi:hypothetical protein
MGLLSFPTTGKRLPWSAPFKRCVFFSFILITWTCFLFTVEAKSFQMNVQDILANAAPRRRSTRETTESGGAEERSGTWGKCRRAIWVPAMCR